MIFDWQARFSNNQAITADAASADIWDMGAIGTPKHAAAPLAVDWGVPDCLFIVAYVTESFDNLTSMNIAVQIDTVENFASPTTIFKTEEIVLADLTAGTWLASLRMPRNANQRYMRLFYDITGTTPTTGQITAGVIAGEQTAFVSAA